MKKILFTFALTLLSYASQAQIKGNGNIVTEKFNVESISNIILNISADTEIIHGTESYIEITTDENLLEWIERSVNKGIVDLNQKKWIQPTRSHRIKISTPVLNMIESSAHGKTTVSNLDQEQIKISGNVGRVILNGRVDHLYIDVKLVDIDASQLAAENADIIITSWGKVKANVKNQLTASVDEDGKLELTGTPKLVIGDSWQGKTEKKREDIEWIDFKIKNNSSNRNQFVVVGPKPDGSNFSYGFPMWAGQVREKHWTTGSKIYKVNGVGFRKLIKTIQASDEGKTVNIF